MNTFMESKYQQLSFDWKPSHRLPVKPWLTSSCFTWKINAPSTVRENSINPLGIRALQISLSINVHTLVQNNWQTQTELWYVEINRLSRNKRKLHFKFLTYTFNTIIQMNKKTNIKGQTSNSIHMIRSSVVLMKHF